MLEAEWNEQASLSPEFKGLKHPVNINLGVIDGGEWPSSVPTECTLDVRIGIPTGITLEVYTLKQKTKDHKNKKQNERGRNKRGVDINKYDRQHVQE